MFQPQYEISAQLIANIKRIAVLVDNLNAKQFTQTVLLEFENNANALSSHSSTSIEGNPLPLTEVKKILKSNPSCLIDTEREVLNYNKALESLKSQTSKPLELKFIYESHSLLMNKLLPRSQIGKPRQEAVFVNDLCRKQVVYWPPDYQDVSKLLTELVLYVNRNKSRIDPLILSGVFHKQFVIIHPFVDGNGRSARLLTKHLLANLGLNTFNLFSFENYYNQNTSKYFAKVGERGNYYDLEIDFTEWLEYFTEGIIDELLRVSQLLNHSALSPETGLQAHHTKMLKYIESHGYINDKLYSKIVDRAKATRSLDFRRLIDLGLIQRFGRGRAIYYKLK